MAKKDGETIYNFSMALTIYKFSMALFVILFLLLFLISIFEEKDTLTYSAPDFFVPNYETVINDKNEASLTMQYGET